ncbi:hypothetical protein PMAC_001914 [Pneumocystis sp. 'macacae']|nr:hypothetical protein PMAC_001914 [Pneumocystis sp. 'macacae']
MSSGPSDAEKNVELWKVRKLIKSLESARGFLTSNGTSMISLIIPPKDQVSRVSKMLGDEYGTASNIKSRVNRLSVLGAITSTREKLKLYNKVPPNGLVIYCGEIITDDGKEKKLSIDFEPFKPINTSLYLCDNKFHTEALSELLESDQKFGFIVMDGNGSLFGTLSGNTREILYKFTVDLPKKHGRGGQSALRFARLREEKRHNYVRKVAEMAVQLFITNDKVNVAGLILAGSADFKTELSMSDMLDARLTSKIVKIVDISYGGENGFNQAIELVSDILSNVKFIQEKRLIQKYFDEVSQDTGKYCYGVEDTLKSLELGAVETIIVWENLDVIRWTLYDSRGDTVIVHLTKEQSEKSREPFIDKETRNEMEIASSISLLEWLTEKYKEFGANLEFVTDKSQEGNQFCKGFSGIAEKQTASEDQQEELNIGSSISQEFSQDTSESLFQQTINGNCQDQTSALLMFLIGDSMQNEPNPAPFSDKKQPQEDLESKQSPEKKKRSQVRNACVNCQKSNKKCDEARPCSRCIKHNLFDSCINSKRKKRQKGLKRGPYKRRNKPVQDKIQTAQPPHSMITMFEAQPTPEFDTYLPEFTAHPLYDFNPLHRFCMQSLPTPPLDPPLTYPNMPFYEDGTTAPPAMLIDPFTRYSMKNVENTQEIMPTLLDDGPLNCTMDHLLETQPETSYRPLPVSHETDLGTLASLCAAVLGEE